MQDPEKLSAYGRSRAVRLADHNYASDTPVHLVICAQEGTPFDDKRLARIVCDAIEHVVAGLGFDLHAYCLMPDHLHVLLSPSASEIAIAKFLRQMKSYTTRQYQLLTRKSQLWQRSARDRVVRKKESLTTLARYIAENPVRKGLVAHWQEWAYTKMNVVV